MHLTPAALEGAIQLLEQPAPLGRPTDHGLGDTVETGDDMATGESDTLVIQRT